VLTGEHHLYAASHENSLTSISDPPQEKTNTQDDGATNPGSNLFVTGIHPRLSEGEVARLFEKYGAVEKCNIMKDPHTRESRGFGFVKMMTAEEADAAKEALQGEVYEGRTLSIEKARRARPRTPTPGKYFGPPKRDDRPPRGGFRDRYDVSKTYNLYQLSFLTYSQDRGYGRRDDYRRGGYRDRYDDRGYGGGRRDDYRGGDRYGYRDDDRYERRGGGGGGYGGGGYDRAPRGPPPEAASYDRAPRDAAPPREYDDRRRNYD
jgi:RNA recognition motif-containing protein